MHLTLCCGKIIRVKEEKSTNIERFKIDKILVDLRFCEFAMTWHGADSYNMKLDERKNWIKEFGNTDTAPYWDEERTKNISKQ